MDVPTMPTPTGWMIIITGIVWLGWEIYVLVTRRQTISNAMYGFAKNNPAVPFLLGFLFGHFFW